MAVQIPCTFFVQGNAYDLIATVGDDIPAQQAAVPPGGLHMACHATYEIIFDALYLTGLTLEKENIRYLPVGRCNFSRNSRTSYQGLSMVVPFTGKVRLVKNFVDEPYASTNYQKAMAFETVLDVTMRHGTVIEVKNRSLEMRQKRNALKKYRESAKKLEKVRRQKTRFGSVMGEPVGPDHRVMHIKDRWEGMVQTGCVLKEYYEAVNNLEKVLYTYGLDMELE